MNFKKSVLFNILMGTLTRHLRKEHHLNYEYIIQLSVIQYLSTCATFIVIVDTANITTIVVSINTQITAHI